MQLVSVSFSLARKNGARFLSQSQSVPITSHNQFLQTFWKLLYTLHFKISLSQPQCGAFFRAKSINNVNFNNIFRLNHKLPVVKIGEIKIVGEMHASRDTRRTLDTPHAIRGEHPAAKTDFRCPSCNSTCMFGALSLAESRDHSQSNLVNVWARTA